jgi:CRISPR/Cas system-associated endoribonuclease Cas2
MEIKNKLYSLQKEVEQIIVNSVSIQQTSINSKISFEFEHSGPSNILNDDERAMSICFISRYEHLPMINSIGISEIEDNFYVYNVGELRHVLNEYRTIILNEQDSIYFYKINNFCRKKLINNDPSMDLSINVRNESGEIINDSIINILNERAKSIKAILRLCDFHYIYNGILQHSDHRFTKRFLEDYHSGQLNYLFIKHALLCGYIKEFLSMHYRIINFLTFPKLGPL